MKPGSAGDGRRRAVRLTGDFRFVERLIEEPDPFV